MKDSDLRGLILTKLYERRREGQIVLEELDFSGNIQHSEIVRICQQLVEHKLIQSQSIISINGIPTIGSARLKITAKGVDIVEENVVSPIVIKFDTAIIQNNHFLNSTISESQIGNDNNQIRKL